MKKVKLSTVNLFVILLFSLLFISCINRDNINHEIDMLTSKPITLPANLIEITSNTNDSISYKAGKLRYICYNETTSCSSCAINKVHFWSKYIEYAERFDGKLTYYFIFQTSKSEVRKLKLALKNSALNYIMLIDSIGEFERLNPHLPKNKAMHTFLLDEDNNVILVGNPLYNKEIEKMFYEQVEKRLL